MASPTVEDHLHGSQSPIPVPSPSQTDAPGSSSEHFAISMNMHLSYPTFEEPHPNTPSVPNDARSLLKDRLYIGNLHPSVDEFTLIQVFSKFGKISKMDFLFHKSGPLKGKPRGYAFVEYASEDDAKKALVGAHNKLLRGRKLVVTFAHQAPIDQMGFASGGARGWRGVTEASKPTTLSLIKSASAGRADATGAKIAKMEAKLRQMEAQSSSSAGHSNSSTTLSTSAHPSLPPKPVWGAPSIATPSTSSLPRQTSTIKREKHVLPNLPLAPPVPSTRTISPRPSTNSTPTPSAIIPHAKTAPLTSTVPVKKITTSLSGVRIVKNKKG